MLRYYLTKSFTLVKMQNSLCPFEIASFCSCAILLHTSIVLQTDDSPNLLAKEELNLLARLMGNMKDESTAETGFRINLFDTDQEEDEA